MYSVVLMMAMSGAADTPAGMFRNRGCDGGCNGGNAGSCYGGGGSCYGGGGGCHGGRGGRKHHRVRGCHGCNGGGGGCYGGMGGCQGGYGGCYGGGGGCYGGMGGYGVPMGAPGGPVRMPETGPAPGTKPAGGGTPPPVAGGGFTAMMAAPATLIVNLPADATLKIDGTATKSTAAVRQFTTPVLAMGQNFHYTLNAEIVRDGKTYSATETVTVRAGQTSQIELPASAFGMAVAAK